MRKMVVHRAFKPGKFHVRPFALCVLILTKMMGVLFVRMKYWCPNSRGYVPIAIYVSLFLKLFPMRILQSGLDSFVTAE